MANFDAQAQIEALREEMAKLHEELAAQSAEVYEGISNRAGKAGRSMRAAARTGAGYVRSEGTAVADAAREHPAAVSTLVLTAGLAGVVIGYLLASAAEPPTRSRYWR
ncbi:hypothetical protein IB238_16770 [Rhizobium sp. ARZ01]|uniref:hypothetical protein n=1 Tax=Rhizobium sp. ARZ01 TaxID=2769313 RepID=UPI00177C32F5|nr:hypothetical protein [Rhizobium sp. ARZ01]MBD9374276.1 hypothetical protein [Rhizobium sp. ARZ01]